MLGFTQMEHCSVKNGNVSLDVFIILFGNKTTLNCFYTYCSSISSKYLPVETKGLRVLCVECVLSQKSIQEVILLCYELKSQEWISFPFCLRSSAQYANQPCRQNKQLLSSKYTGPLFSITVIVPYSMVPSVTKRWFPIKKKIAKAWGTRTNN